MLTLSKAASGDQIPKEPLALEPIVADVVANLSDRAARKGLVLRAEFNAGGRMILGDAPLIRQLLTNLVDNAIKFTDARRDRRRALARLRRPCGSRCSDTGIGISPENAERLFDRFFRGDASHSRTVEGTGLGLAIVRSIARVHGGTVSAAGRTEAAARSSRSSSRLLELPAEDPLLTENQ